MAKSYQHAPNKQRRQQTCGPDMGTTFAKAQSHSFAPEHHDPCKELHNKQCDVAGSPKDVSYVSDSPLSGVAGLLEEQRSQATARRHSGQHLPGNSGKHARRTAM